MSEWDRVVQLHNSRAISEVCYNFTDKELSVTFPRTNSVWVFSQVWPSEFGAFVCAYSPGEFFNERIRPRYEGRRIFPPPETEEGRTHAAQ